MTPAVNPGNEIRAAARTVRAVAADAVSGPWSPMPVPGDRGTDIVDLRGVYLAKDLGKQDAAWIVLTNPLLADPLAALLDDHARQEDTYDCPLYDCPALILARFINGGSRG